MSTTPRPARPAPLRAVLAAGVVAALAGLAGCGSSDTSVSGPTSQERQETVAQLARAAQEQGICYGWRLAAGYSTGEVSTGSNLGDTVPVDSDSQRCPRWVEVSANVYYVSESSESEDSATVTVTTSPGLNVGSGIDSRLDRLGLTEQAFIDDPALAVSRAVLALPLLTAEAGAARPAPTPTAPPAAAPDPLEPAGGDFWRDRAGFVWTAVAVLATAGLLFFIGMRLRSGQQRRDQQRRQAPQSGKNQQSGRGPKPGNGTRSGGQPAGQSG